MGYLYITNHGTRESFEIIIIMIISRVQHHNTSSFKSPTNCYSTAFRERHNAGSDLGNL